VSSDTFIGGVRAAHKVITTKVSRLKSVYDELKKIAGDDPRYRATYDEIAKQVSLLTALGGEIAELSTKGPDDTPLAPLPEAPPAA